ncbi:MAG: TIM barrel protein [Armatimonadota bacterium]|nr:TIM barrel protein [Armatimonadota bacterium]MDR7404364.1 TIM barrel protein [Armatimonadota bacterium]
MSELCPCLDALWAGRPAEPALGLLAEEGFRLVEFWDWRERNIDHLAAQLENLGMSAVAFSGTTFEEPLLDPAGHEAALAHLRTSLEVARRLGTRLLVVHVGYARSDRPRSAQWEAAVVGLRRAADLAQAAGVRLLVEPLNSVLDHPGYFLDSLPDALALLEDVGHPAVGLLLDVYHMWVTHDDLLDRLEGAAARAGHVHVADVPGRGEPGSGVIPWRAVLDRLRAGGYRGALGLECWPTADVRGALRRCREVLDA